MAKDDHPIWRKPQHHMDADNPTDHVHWTELFYDLIHVVTIFMLGNYLSHHLDWSGFFTFAALFITLWMAWGDLSVFNSLYVSTDFHHRGAMALQICTVMMMAASIPAIAGQGWPFFALAYAANRLIIAWLYIRARRTGSDTSNIPTEMFRNFVLLAAIAALSAFLPKPWNYAVLLSGVVLNLAIYLFPGLSIVRYERFVPRLGHMVERFALLLLIVLGEGFFKLVITLSDLGIDQAGPEVLINVTVSAIAIFVLCWLYFDFIGHAKPKDTRPATMITLWVTHMLLMLGGTMVGVALSGEVKVGFMQPFPMNYAWLGCLGLALYLAMLYILQNTVEHRTAHRFASPGLTGFGIVLALFTLIVTPYVPAIVGNILWCTALFSQVLVPLFRARTTISQEEDW